MIENENTRPAWLTDWQSRNAEGVAKELLAVKEIEDLLDSVPQEEIDKIRERSKQLAQAMFPVNYGQCCNCVFDIAVDSSGVIIYHAFDNECVLGRGRK